MVTIVMTFGVADVFMKNVFKIHEIPSKNICNQVTKFLNEFWTTLFKICEIKIKFCTTYQP